MWVENNNARQAWCRRFGNIQGDNKKSVTSKLVHLGLLKVKYKTSLCTIAKTCGARSLRYTVCCGYCISLHVAAARELNV